MTIRDLITGSLRLLGVLAQGETIEAASAQDALRSLNSMIDSWSLERLMVVSQQEHVVTLNTSRQFYGVGPGSDIDVPRALAIIDMSYRDISGATETFLPVLQYTQAQYASLAVLDFNGVFPQAFFYDAAFPYGNLYVYPTPLAGTQLRFWSSEALSDVASLDTILNLAPGYEKTMRYGLALELAPEYGVEPSATIVSQFQTAKGNIERQNARPQTLILDTVPTSNRFNHGNIFTGV